MTKKESRRASRERAFQVLYGLGYIPAQDGRALRQAFLDNPAVFDTGKTEAEGFSWDLVHGAWSMQKELDEAITRHSQHWRIERIGRIELTILRLGMYEMLHRPDVPVKVAINEAVELAKQFGDANSPSFINGILDAAAKNEKHG